MRRKEFHHDDPALLEELSARCPEGYLALGAGDDYPRAVALNFALQDGCIYFHGALAGNKFDRIQASSRAGFTIALPYSMIPSDWSTKNGSACPATQLYISVEIKGICELVANADEKARGLQVLMEKYQPEGGYRPFVPQDSRYEKPIHGVGVFRLKIDEWSAKVRLSQENSVKFRLKLIERLRNRGLPIDLETADRIESMLETGELAED